MSTVLLADSDFPDDQVERAMLADAGLDLVAAARAAGQAHDAAGLAELAAATPDAVGLLVQWTRVDEALLDALPALRVVGRFGVGVDTVDVAAASRRGIAVVHSGDYATEEVAVHTVAMALALLRRLPAGDRAVRSGAWTGAGHFRGMRRLSHRRAGVVGLGRIGQRVAALLRAAGMDVAGYDPAVSAPEVAQAASLDELLAASDLVSLHVPLVPATRRLLDARRLALMPPGSVLVNTARGGLVDEEALRHELRPGRLAGAALDVFEEEPMSPDHPLAHQDGVLLSPHVGYFSDEALLEARARTTAGVVAVIRGEQPRDVANPDVLAGNAGGAGGAGSDRAGSAGGAGSDRRGGRR